MSLMDSVTRLANLSRPTPGMKDFRLAAGLGVGRGEEEAGQDSGLELCLITLAGAAKESATLQAERSGLHQSSVLHSAQWQTRGSHCHPLTSLSDSSFDVFMGENQNPCLHFLSERQLARY